MGASSVDRLSLLGPTGTGKVMAGELSRLATRASLAQHLERPRREGPGTLSYPFHPPLAALAVQYHRTSSRVLWDLYRSDAQRLEPLYEGLRAQAEAERRPFLRDGLGVSVSARNVGAFEAGERQVVGTVKNALVDGAARHGVKLHLAPDAPDLHVVVAMRDGALVVSLDLAGRPMNQRGYRGATGDAPLRESLAAVMVMLARHDGRSEPLFDPMAGTGTLAIEAACMAQGRPVWVPPRTPACLDTPPFDAHLLPAPPLLFADTRPLCIVNELSPDTAALCDAQCERAGVDALVERHVGDFRQLSPDTVADAIEARGFGTGRGLILCNPPYGVRLEDPELLDLYRDLGEYCEVFRGWRAAFLVGHPGFERAFGGRPRVKKPLSNAALKTTFLLYDL